MKEICIVEEDLLSRIPSDNEDGTLEEMNEQLGLMIDFFYDNNPELLSEENVIRPEDGKKISGVKIGIEQDGSGQTYYGFDMDPYFKVFKNGGNTKANNKNDITRIAILKPEYSSHNNDSNGGWKLNNKEKEALVKILSFKCKIDKHPEITTYWQYLLFITNKYCILKKLPMDTSMPDYRLL